MTNDDNMPLHDHLDSEHVCVNVVQNPYRRQQTGFQNKQQYRQQPPRPDNPHAKPYDKIRNTRQNQSFQNRKIPNSRGKPFTKHKSVVCDACGMFGHDHMNCNVTPKVLHILEWAKTHKELIPTILRKHKSLHSLEGRRAVVRHLMAHDNIHEDYEDDLMENPVFDDEINSMTNTLSVLHQE